MAASAKQLTPDASCRHRFGAELRRWREACGWSQQELAWRVLHSVSLVGKVERAERWPTQRFAALCDEAMHTGAALIALWPDVERERANADRRSQRTQRAASAEAPGEAGAPRSVQARRAKNRTRLAQPALQRIRTTSRAM